MKKIGGGLLVPGNPGLVVPGKLRVGGRFGVQVLRNGVLSPIEWHPNLVVDQFCNHLLDVSLSGGTQVTSWYVGLFKGNYTPVALDTGANIAAHATECTQYAESTRPAWVEAGPSAKNIDNSASKATFTINAGVTVYGAFLCSNATKSDSSSGTILAAAAKFTASRALVADDQILITYAIGAADDGV